MQAGILDLCEDALRVFAHLGAEVVPLAPAFPADALWDSWTQLRAWQHTARLAPLAEHHKADLSANVIFEVEKGLALSAMDVHRASVIRSRWFETAAELFDQFDALVLPSAQVWPFPVDAAHPSEIAGVAMDTYHRWMEVVIPPSLIGLPALALPAGFGADNLPMGIQIFGRRGSDSAMLSIGAAYHAETRWPDRRPALP